MRKNKVSKTAFACGFVLTILALACVTSVAQTVKSKTEKQILNLTRLQESAAQLDEDEKLDESVRKYGSAAGGRVPVHS